MTKTKTRKSPRSTARRTYDDATKAAAVAMVRASGLAESAAEFDVPKPTLLRWAKAAGVDTADATKRSIAQNELAGAAASSRRRRLVEEALERTAEIMAASLVRAAQVELGMLSGRLPTFVDPETGHRTTPSDLSLHEVVGSRKWLFEQLRLHTDKSTTNVDARNLIVFGKPPADPKATIVIDEKDLPSSGNKALRS